MSTLHLYWTLGSQPSRAIKSLLLAGGVEHETHDVDMGKGEHKSPEILALNPKGAVPFITQDGVAMNESAAILRYLSQKHPQLNQFYSGSLEQQHEIDAMLDFNATAFRPSMTSKVMPSVMKKLNNMENLPPLLQALYDSSPEKVKTALEALEAALTRKGTKYLCGDSITIADFQIYAEFCDVYYMGMSFAEYPKITAWAETCRASAGLKEVHDDWEKIVPGFREFFEL